MAAGQESWRQSAAARAQASRFDSQPTHKLTWVDAPAGAFLSAPPVDVVPTVELLLVKLFALVLCDQVLENALGNRAFGFPVELLEELADGGLVRGDDAAVLKYVLGRGEGTLQKIGERRGMSTRTRAPTTCVACRTLL